MPYIPKKIMSDVEAQKFIEDLGRKELWDNTKHRYLWYKAICVTIISLGYDEGWVYGHFRDMLEDYWNAQLGNEKKHLSVLDSQESALNRCYQCSGDCYLIGNETRHSRISVTETRLILGKAAELESKKSKRKQSNSKG